MYSLSDWICEVHIRMKNMLRLDRRSSGRASASCQVSARADGSETSAGNCQQSFRVTTEDGWGKAGHLGNATEGFSWKCPEVTQAQKICRTPLSVIKHKFTLNTRHFPERFECLTSEVMRDFQCRARIYTNHHTFDLSHLFHSWKGNYDKNREGFVVFHWNSSEKAYIYFFINIFNNISRQTMSCKLFIEFLKC